MKHALVVGGTGMLAQASLWLSQNGYHVSVIGRNPEKMQRLIEQNPQLFSPVLVDYKNTDELTNHLQLIHQLNGPVHLVLAWVHSDGPDVIPCLMDSLPEDTTWKLFHIHGSSSDIEEIKTTTAVPAHVRYHQIQLGFQLENGDSRWLTHKEISDGVIKALLHEKAAHLVGTLTPLEKRP